nr:MAG TPA: hypothetical protein [Caudoviricetes sp.]
MLLSSASSASRLLPVNTLKLLKLPFKKIYRTNIRTQLINHFYYRKELNYG